MDPGLLSQKMFTHLIHKYHTELPEHATYDEVRSSPSSARLDRHWEKTFREVWKLSFTLSSVTDVCCKKVIDGPFQWTLMIVVEVVLHFLIGLVFSWSSVVAWRWRAWLDWLWWPLRGQIWFGCGSDTVIVHVHI